MFKNYYHLCTTALRNTVLCRDREDYIRLWNGIVVYSSLYGIRIFSLCLMSNHIHILLQAERKSIELFFRMLKIQYARYLKKKYGRTPSKEWEYKIFPVTDRKAFCQEVAYILRNAYKARISSPLSYSWCSTAIYFTGLIRVGKRTGEMSVREIASILNTREKISPNFLVSPDGMILPESFIDIQTVEKMYGGSSVLFFDMLKKWNLEDIVNDLHGEEVPEAYSDEEVAAGIQSICRDEFGNLAPSGMDQKTKGRLIRKVYARYGSSRSQLLRLLPVDSFLLERVL